MPNPPAMIPRCVLLCTVRITEVRFRYSEPFTDQYRAEVAAIDRAGGDVTLIPVSVLDRAAGTIDGKLAGAVGSLHSRGAGRG
nr:MULTISPECIES: hypothetical protein [unclassified Brevundimonas]